MARRFIAYLLILSIVFFPVTSSAWLAGYSNGATIIVTPAATRVSTNIEISPTFKEYSLAADGVFEWQR